MQETIIIDLLSTPINGALSHVIAGTSSQLQDADEHRPLDAPPLSVTEAYCVNYRK